MRLSHTHFTFPVRVYHEDVDDGGVVYYANYLKYLERARTEWLRTLGFDQRFLKDESSVQFLVSRVHIDYLRPARFNDLLVVGVKMARCARASIGLVQEVCREPEEVLASAEVRLACVDAASFRPTAMPRSLLTELKRDH